MGWSIGYDEQWNRDIGYGVPATCDHPACGAKIDRGLSFVCGSDVAGGNWGCGLFFCSAHKCLVDVADGTHPCLCERCAGGYDVFTPTADTPEWINHKLTDASWAQWRAEYPADVARLHGTMGAGHVRYNT